MINRFVVIDLETTGNLPKKGDKIIQFAAVVVEEGKIIEKYSSLLNPNRSIPPFIEELTGINDEMVKNAPFFSEIAPKIVQLLEGAFFVAHNVLFDLSFLQEELIQAGFSGFYGPVLDTVEMARILYPTADGYKLTDLAELKNLNHERPHQADSDAEVTAELLNIMLERFVQIPQRTLSQLAQLSGGLKSDLDQLLEEFLVRKEKSLEELPESIEIIHGLALRKRRVLYSQVPEKIEMDYPYEEKEKVRIFKKALAEFQKRPGQFQMMDAVYEALQTGRHAIVEAGTGIGKSLGYLLPAAWFAISKKQPVVISTHTIQLQEQLIQREVPLLSETLPGKLKVAILKGKNHYLNLEKFNQSLLNQNDNYDSVLTKMQILIWLTETETGDKDELNLSSGGHIFWEKIKSDHSFFHEAGKWDERDFYLRASNEARQADLIITNHALLLRDAASRQNILPEYSFAIIDEGHHLPKEAASFLGDTLDYLSVRLLLTHLGQYDQKQLFYRFEQLLTSIGSSKMESLVHTFTVNQLITDLLYEMDEFFKLIAHSVEKQKKHKSNTLKAKVRFDRNQPGKEITAVIHSGERFAFLLKDLLLIFSERVNAVQQCSLTSQQKMRLDEFISLLAELEHLSAILQKLLLSESNMVMWMEVDFRAPQNMTSLYAQPPSVAEYLKNIFFEKKTSVVLTSATLSVDHSFEFILDEVGLDKNETMIVDIPSPFQYKKQVQMLIPKDLPDIKKVSMEEYVIEITEQIISIAEAAKGRMLILFTAYDMLKKTYDLIKESGLLDDYAIIAQGVTGGSRTRLTRNFQRYEKAILLGTSSFWEGVDVPGEDLSCLVIVRLPFSPPNEPFTEAKCEYVKQNGGNPFTDYSLPEAILRFKQGFGRLIRTETDRGVIVVFDRRIVSTNYGHHFLKSIPDITVKERRTDEMVEEIKLWLR